MVRWLGLLLLLGSCATLAAPALAQVIRTRPAGRIYYPSNRMPGWDWERTYPYSPYNEWRNRVYPYAVPYYYPVPTYQQPDYASGGALPRPQDVLIPHATGPLRTPPPNSALIVVRVPAEFTPILFDGIRTTSVGTLRYYSTPELPVGRSLTYTIAAVVERNGQPFSEERQISVMAGQTTFVNFTRPNN